MNNQNNQEYSSNIKVNRQPCGLIGHLPLPRFCKGRKCKECILNKKLGVVNSD